MGDRCRQKVTGCWKQTLWRRLVYWLCLYSWALMPTVEAKQNTLIITGSDTLGGVVTAWTRAFQASNPDVAVEIQAAGSAAAPTALAEGTANIGMMSRAMSDGELARFVARRGHLPTAIALGRDALVIIVANDNPLSAIDRSTVDRIWSSTRYCSGGAAIDNWGQVPGIATADRLADEPVEAVGRTSISGSYGFFKQRALCDGDLAPHVAQLQGFAAIVDLVASKTGAIGYAGLGFVDDRVKALAWLQPSQPPIAVSYATADAWERYPLARTVMFYLATPPDVAPGPLECRFLSFIQEPQAQQTLRDHGFIPITNTNNRGVTTGGC